MADRLEVQLANALKQYAQSSDKPQLLDLQKLKKNILKQTQGNSNGTSSVYSGQDANGKPTLFLNDNYVRIENAGKLAVSWLDIMYKDQQLLQVNNIDSFAHTLARLDDTSDPQKPYSNGQDDSGAFITERYTREVANNANGLQSINSNTSFANFQDFYRKVGKNERELVESVIRDALFGEIHNASDDWNEGGAGTYLINSGEQSPLLANLSTESSAAESTPEVSEAEKKEKPKGTKVESRTKVGMSNADSPKYSENVYVQSKLQSLRDGNGKPYYSGLVDGKWGPISQAALEAWMKDNPNQKLIEDASEVTSAGNMFEAGYTYAGVQAENVKAIQTFLNTQLSAQLQVNGKYDKQTIEAVLAFQKAHNKGVSEASDKIPEDGIWGPRSTEAAQAKDANFVLKQ